jgi:hypothetical protein
MLRQQQPSQPGLSQAAAQMQPAGGWTLLGSGASSGQGAGPPQQQALWVPQSSAAKAQSQATTAEKNRSAQVSLPCQPLLR